MRFTERAFLLPANRMSWVPSQPYYPPWRRTHLRRQDQGLHPLEHLLQELAMLEDNPQRGCSRSRQNMLQHEGHSPYDRTGCLRNVRRPEPRRYNPYQPEYAECMRILRRPSVQNPKEDSSEGTVGRLVPHTDQAQWHTSFDVSGFKPGNISVKVENRTVHLSAKSKERSGSRFMVSEVSRSERLPGDADVGSVTAWLNDNGVMHVTANRKPQPLEVLQSKRNDLPQPEESVPKGTPAADIVIEVCAIGEGNVHVAVEDPKTDSTGKPKKHSGELVETVDVTSLCTGTEDRDAAQTESTQKKSTDTDTSQTEGDFSAELSNKAQEEDAYPKEDDIVLIHEDRPALVCKQKGADDAEIEEVMVTDDSTANQETTPAVEDQAHHEAPSSQKDNDTTLVETTSTNPIDTPFKVTLNMSTYDPEDLHVGVSGRQVHVTAERSLQHPGGSTMYRRYAKSFPLPPSADTDSVTSVMTSEGQLTVTATSRRPELEDRVVAIERV